MGRRDPEIEYKTPDQIALMRAAGLVVAKALATMRAAVAPGVTTADLDALAEGVIRDAGAVPSFKGYHGYPATICSSVNEQIVHAIPSREAGAARRRPDLHRLRRDPRRLARRRGDLRARRARSARPDRRRS